MSYTEGQIFEGNKKMGDEKGRLPGEHRMSTVALTAETREKAEMLVDKASRIAKKCLAKRFVFEVEKIENLAQDILHSAIRKARSVVAKRGITDLAVMELQVEEILHGDWRQEGLLQDLKRLINYACGGRRQEVKGVEHWEYGETVSIFAPICSDDGICLLDTLTDPVGSKAAEIRLLNHDFDARFNTLKQAVGDDKAAMFCVVSLGEMSPKAALKLFGLKNWEKIQAECIKALSAPSSAKYDEPYGDLTAARALSKKELEQQREEQRNAIEIAAQDRKEREAAAVAAQKAIAAEYTSECITLAGSTFETLKAQYEAGIRYVSSEVTEPVAEAAEVVEQIPGPVVPVTLNPKVNYIFFAKLASDVLSTDLGLLPINEFAAHVRDLMTNSAAISEFAFGVADSATIRSASTVSQPINRTWRRQALATRRQTVVAKTHNPLPASRSSSFNSSARCGPRVLFERGSPRGRPEMLWAADG